MLDRTFEKYDNIQVLIFLYDYEWQYQHAYYQKGLLNRGIKQSISRKGNVTIIILWNCFLGTLKNEKFTDLKKVLKFMNNFIIKFQLIFIIIKEFNEKQNGCLPALYMEASTMSYKL